MNTTIWQDLFISALIIAGSLALAWLARLLLGRLGRRAVRRTRTRLDDLVLAAAATPLRAAIVVVGAEIALARLAFLPANWRPEINRTFFALYTVLTFLFIYRLLGALFRWYGQEVAHKTDTDLDDKFIEVFRRLALAVATAILIVTLLGRYGIEVTALVTTLGIGSLAIALAAQETLGDMFAGFTIMLDQPFRVGDRVELLDINTWGDVIEIGLRSTRIRTRDNRLVTVPNSVIGKGLIVNYSEPNTRYRVETHVGVAYGTDIELARQTMIAAIRAEEWVMADELIEALFLEFGESALVFRVRCWIENYVETRRVMDKMNSALYKALNEAQIVIPFPQRDLHLVSSRVPLGDGP